MITKRFYFKEHFPKLGENGCNAYMDCYIPSAFQDAGLPLKHKFGKVSNKNASLH